MIVISSALLTLLVNYICHDQEKSKKGTYKKGGSIKEIQMMSLYPPFLYVPFLELFFQVTYSLSKFFWLWCRHSLCPKCPMVQKKVVHREDICWHLFQQTIGTPLIVSGPHASLAPYLLLQGPSQGVQNALSSPTFSEFRQGK